MFRQLAVICLLAIIVFTAAPLGLFAAGEDADALARNGIRRLDGKHLTLYTDLPPSRAVDELPAVFDLAFPQWCKYFAVAADEHSDWHVTGFLMKDKNLFARLRLLPPGDPPFRHGFSQGDRLWLYEQPSDYYRRHLLLHEGTHAFMNTLLGSCGPPWYMEGTAELLATHRYAAGRLKLNFFPADKSQTPMWGRIKLVADAMAAGEEKTLDDVLAFGPDAHLEIEPYAWCWAAAALLDRHPRYRESFRQLYKNVRDADFNQHFRRSIGDDWPDLAAQWQAFCAALDFGHDIPRETLSLQPAAPLPAKGKTVKIAADQGWQNAGVILRGGQKYRLTAKGRYQVADQPKIWWCEPGGVTIRYYRGHPLGILLAAVHPGGQAFLPAKPDNTPVKTPAQNPFIDPVPIGLESTLIPTSDGVLFLKINDSPAELRDNAGCLHIRIEPTALTD